MLSTSEGSGVESRDGVSLAGAASVDANSARRGADSSSSARAWVDFRSRVVLMAYRYDKPSPARRQSPRGATLLRPVLLEMERPRVTRRVLLESARGECALHVFDHRRMAAY